MAATHTVTLYAVIVALLCFALGFLVVWSRRELRMRLLGIGLSVGMVPVIWFAFSQLPGKPNSMSADEFREKYRCTTIIPVALRENSPIYLLAKKKRAREPEYISITWNRLLATSLQQSMRAAQLNGKGSIVYARASCADDEEDGEEGGTGKGKGKGKKGKGKPGNGQGAQGRLPGSSGQEQNGGDDFTFYPDPVPSMPEKNYGPTYEGPLVMPERQ